MREFYCLNSIFIGFFLAANLEQPPSATFRTDCGIPFWVINPRTVTYWNGNAYIWGTISLFLLNIGILTGSVR